MRGNQRAAEERRHLHPDEIDRILRKYAKRIGLDRGYSAHSMRAMFITTALDNGASLEDVQRAAGHADPSTTKLYDRRGYNPEKGKGVMLQDVLARVQEIDETFRRSGSTTWYRGHRRSEWQLKSTLHRHIERLTSDLDPPFSHEEKRDLLRDEEKSLYRRFKADAWPLLGSAERSDWGVIFTMQHYLVG